MKRKFITIALVSLFLFNAAFAQQEVKRNIKLGFVAGVENFFGEFNKPEQIRGLMSYDNYYYDEYDNSSVQGSSSYPFFYTGVSGEYFLWRNRIGFASGLRFGYGNTEINATGDYFYWVLRSSATETRYVTLKSIYQDDYYISIPLEVRFFNNNQELPFQVYFKAGGSLNYRFTSQREINFVNSAMEKYNDEIEKQLSENEDKFFIYAYAALGFKIGKLKMGDGNKVWVNVEFHIPFMLTTDNTSFITEKVAGLGMQVSVQMPVGTNEPIAYRQSIELEND
ncbi:MAG: hypothetical protein LBR17_03875 [Bacteroidales bacterium]|nr:hypothetical protein [Bacteroidales bacterium]